MDGKVFKENQANEKNFVKNLENHDIIHLAMHAFLDEENPRNSKLVFTPDLDTTYDNFLHSYELYNMDIKSQLTVLSACNTGNGSFTGGEGVMSLARAFTYAGSESVVMSHWMVDDQSSKELMNHFYHFLSQGFQKDEALRQAKIKYLDSASPNKSHPFFWGAFVLIGNTSSIIKENSFEWLFYGIIIFGIVLIMGILFFIFKREKIA